MDKIPRWTEAAPADLRDFALSADPTAVAESLVSATREHNRWHHTSLNLVASHNVMSPLAKALLRSDLDENISAGHIGQRPHSGAAWLDVIETILVSAAQRLFGANGVEYRASSGAAANGLFIAATMRPGDHVMVLEPKYGGDPTYFTGSYPTLRGLRLSPLPCTGADYPRIDLEALAIRMKDDAPKWIVIGSATQLFPYPLAEVVKIASPVGAKIWYDAAHVMGLAAGHIFQGPLAEGAIAMTGSTQKTLGGPVGGLILTADDALGRQVEETASALLSNYANNRCAALAVTLCEWLVYGRDHALAVVENARALAQFLDDEGLRVVGRDNGFTQSHIVLVDTQPYCEPLDARQRLEAAHISCTASRLPRTYPAHGAIRLGTSAVTRRGMGAAEMRLVASLIRRSVVDREDPSRIAAQVKDLALAFVGVKYSFSRTMV